MIHLAKIRGVTKETRDVELAVWSEKLADCEEEGLPRSFCAQGFLADVRAGRDRLREAIPADT
jgi:hypothetical protein